jgi:RHS repeat-associated protein
VATIYDATWTNTRSTSSYANVTLYTGRELDPETGLYYYRNRYYSAELGRFVSRDPIVYWAGDVNLYRYVRNRATNVTDLSGLRIRVENPKPSLHVDDFIAIKRKETFAQQVMLALQAVIGDCATLQLTNKKHRNLGWSDTAGFSLYLESADIEYYGEKPGCRNDCCWQDLKKALEDDRVYDVRYAWTEAQVGWHRREHAAKVNPDIPYVLWEITSGGYLIAAEIPFGALLWHEVIAHGLHGIPGHPPVAAGNRLDPNSDFYDRAIRIENMARRCLGVRERAYQYHPRPRVKVGELRDYWEPVPVPPRRIGPGPWIGAAP